jgi:large subunit ribosomal protein L4
MLKIQEFSSKGVKTGDLTLPNIMEVGVNKKAVAQAIRVYEDRSHKGLSKVKTRSEIALSTRKIYKQKGTGGARHGAKSAPIFAGGGVAHGPKGIKRVLTLSKRAKKYSMYSVLNEKIKKSEVFVVSGIKEIIKSKQADQLLVKLTGSVKPIPTIVAVSKENESVRLAFRNLKNLHVKLFENLNAYDLVNYKYVVLDSAVFPKSNNKEVKPKTELKKSESKVISKTKNK